jgi:hypothetical protein
MFIAALFTIAKVLWIVIVNILQLLVVGNTQDEALLMNEWRKCGIYIQWNFIQPQRRVKFCCL